MVDLRRVIAVQLCTGVRTAYSSYYIKEEHGQPPAFVEHHCPGDYAAPPVGVRAPSIGITVLMTLPPHQWECARRVLASQSWRLSRSTSGSARIEYWHHSPGDCRPTSGSARPEYLHHSPGDSAAPPVGVRAQSIGMCIGRWTDGTYTRVTKHVLLFIGSTDIATP